MNAEYLGSIFLKDQNLNKIRDLFYPIIMILRVESEGRFDYKLQDKDVVIQTPEGEELLRVAAHEFLVEAEHLLRAINESKGRAFAVPETKRFMDRVLCHSLKAKRENKADIRIILHDRRTRLNSEMGFSIKSRLGEDSTLMNAGQSTNFNFKIEGASFSNRDIERINSLNSASKVIDRYDAIKRKGGRLVFDKVDNPVLRNNLIMLDGDLQTIIAGLLLAQLDNGISSLKELTKKLNESNPLNYDNVQDVPFYAYKIKHLLTSVALGMVPTKPWNGKLDANGGYLVVKEDGDVLCYHFYDRNRFEEFLFNYAYLERASISRHKYAVIIKEDDGTLSFKLNLQIRLK